MKKIALILLSFSAFCSAAQTTNGDCSMLAYNRMLNQAELYMKDQSYAKADLKYRAARVCQPQMATFIDSMLTVVRQAIVRQKEVAEKAARANANAATAFKIEKTDPTLALRIAWQNWQQHTEDPSSISTLHEIISRKENGFCQTTLQGHDNFVMTAAFSPDAQRLVSGSADGTVRIWDVSGREIRRFKAHKTIVISAQFTPDGTGILTGGDDNNIILWDTLGRQKSIYKGHTGNITALAFSPDGQYFVSGSKDKTARLWHINGRNLNILNGHRAGVIAVAFSRDGKSILTASKDSTARLWSVNGQMIQEFIGHRDDVTAVDFSLDGQRILTSSRDATAILWTYQGKQIKILVGHTDGIERACFSPDSKSILTGSSDGTARLWNSDGQILQILRGHNDLILFVAFSPKGDKVATASNDKTIKIWNIQNFAVQSFKSQKGAITAIGISSQFQCVITGSTDKTIHIWDFDGKSRQILRGHQGTVEAIAIAPNDSFFISGSADKTVCLWSIPDGQLIQRFDDIDFEVQSVSIMNDGCTASVRDKANKSKIIRLPLPCATVTAEEEKALDKVSNSIDQFMDKLAPSLEKMQEFESRIEEAKKNNDFTAMNKIAADAQKGLFSTSWVTRTTLYSITAKAFLTAKNNGDIELLDTKRRNLLTIYQAHKEVTALAIASDGGWIASADAEGVAKLWLTPRQFMKQRVETFSISALLKEGYQPEPNEVEDLSSIEDLESLAQTFESQGKNQQAAQLYEKIWAKNGNSESTALQLIKLCERNKLDYSAFFQNFLKTSTPKSLNKVNTFFKDQANIGKSDWKMCETVLQRLLTFEDTPDNRFELYNAQGEQGKADFKAIFLVADTMKLKEYFNYFTNMAVINKQDYYSFIGFLHKATQIADKALETTNDIAFKQQVARAYNSIVFLEMINKKIGDAEKALNRGIKIDPANINLKFNTMYIYFFKGDLENTKLAYEKLKNQPLSPMALKQALINDFKYFTDSKLITPNLMANFTEIQKLINQ